MFFSAVNFWWAKAGQSTTREVRHLESVFRRHVIQNGVVQSYVTIGYLEASSGLTGMGACQRVLATPRRCGRHYRV